MARSPVDLQQRRDDKKEVRRKFVFAAVSRLETGFTTRQASDAMVELDRRLFRNFSTGPLDRLTKQQKDLLSEFRRTGLHGAPHSALNYLKELEAQGLLIKRLVNQQTLRPVNAAAGDNGTYQWFWVGEPGMPAELREAEWEEFIDATFWTRP